MRLEDVYVYQELKVVRGEADVLPEGTNVTVLVIVRSGYDYTSKAEKPLISGVVVRLDAVKFPGYQYPYVWSIDRFESL